MRLPRDVSGEDVARRLSRLGYSVTRQTGSHMRLTTDTPKQHHVSIPKHDALRIGTLAAFSTTWLHISGSPGKNWPAGSSTEP